MELLLTLTIILLLASLLLPALNRGHHKVRTIHCTSNLHQAGLGFLSFAQGHEDKFPTQVSTNAGGSAEFLNAGQAVQGDYYFSYKHFLPLASELESPKLLVCPTDLRTPATNFASLNNSNLSYFANASPQFGNSDSMLAGDRNLKPVSNTVARLGPRRPLRWTGEMHQNRGNVLYADGHVEQRGESLSLSNRPGTPPVSLIMPSLPSQNASALAGPATASAGGGGGIASPGPGGNLKASWGKTNINFAATNATPLTNLNIETRPRKTPPFAIPGPRGEQTLPDSLPFPGATTSAPPRSLSVAAADNPDSNDEQQVESDHQDLVQAGQGLVKRGARFVYGVPWWVILALLILALWLLKRVHERRPQPKKKISPDPSFSVSGR
jgi:prepilin-type processing-associated H-X9-DG protein